MGKHERLSHQRCTLLQCQREIPQVRTLTQGLEGTKEVGKVFSLANVMSCVKNITIDGDLLLQDAE